MRIYSEVARVRIEDDGLTWLVTLHRADGRVVRALLKLEEGPEFDGSPQIRLHWAADPDAEPNKVDWAVMEGAVKARLKDLDPDMDFQPLPTVQ